MSSCPISHFVIIPNRPIVQSDGEVIDASLKLHYWEWQGHHPTVLFCHAASFHSRCYDRIINEALHGFHVIALDFRGHSRSQQHPPPYRFRWFGDDVLQFIETLNLSKNNLIGIGHSLGGYALTWAASKASTRLFQALLLFDPGIIPRSLYRVSDENTSPFEYILRRKNQWSSVEDMISRLETCQPFSKWSKDILQSYCRYALNENFNLTCTSEIEFSIYQTALQTNSNIYPLIEQSKFIKDIPIHVVRSSLPLILGRFDTSPTAPDLVKCFQKGRDTLLENSTHFFPMEQPDLAIHFVKEMIKERIQSQL